MEETALFLGDIEEENNLMGGDFKGANMSTSRRCRILGDPATAGGGV